MEINLGDTIKRLRVEQKLSQQELADLAGVHRTHINRIENNQRSPRFEDVVNILECLGYHILFSKNDRL